MNFFDTHYILIYLLSALLVFVFVPLNSKYMLSIRNIGKDMNKKDKPEVPEMGGNAVLLSCSISMLILYFVENPHTDVFFFILTFVLVGLVGIEDGIYNYRRRILGRQKVLHRQFLKTVLILMAATPLVYSRSGDSVINFYNTDIDFGVYYWFILVPIGISAASNCTNLLAGMNGLEIGLGVISYIFVSYKLYNIDSFLFPYSFIILLGLSSFLWFNKFPAEVFPGDVGTLIIGGGIAAISIIAGIQWFCVFILILPIMEFLIKPFVSFNAENFGVISEDGKLHPPSSIQSLTHVVLRYRPLSERNLVYVFYMLQSFVGFLAIFIFR